MLNNLALVETTNQCYEGLSNTKLMGLIYSSGIASKLNLSNPAIIVLNSFAYHWNTIRNDCFPTQDLIASKTGLSVSSIKRGIKELLTKNLIIKTKKGNSSTNLYKFTGKFFELLNLNSRTAQIEPYLKVNLTPTCHEHKKVNIRKKQTSSIKKINNLNRGKTTNDDGDFSKTTDIEEYKSILIQMEKWAFIGAKFAIKKYGVEKIKTLIEIVKSKNPTSPGAYLRTLLNCPDQIIQQPKNNPHRANLNEGLEAVKKVLAINEPRLSREEIIDQLIQQGKTEEVQVLKTIWRC